MKPVRLPHSGSRNYRTTVCLTLLLFCLTTHSFAQSELPRDTIPPPKSETKPNPDNDYDKTFVKVEVESAFPGGPKAWLNFLQQNMVYPKKAIKKNIQGTVLLQFIVGRDGRISDLSAINGDPLLIEAALEVMHKSPRWTPAYQSGRTVRSYKRQPIIFRLE